MPFAIENYYLKSNFKPTKDPSKNETLDNRTANDYVTGGAHPELYGQIQQVCRLIIPPICCKMEASTFGVGMEKV